jgi:hypothetical protein
MTPVTSAAASSSEHHSAPAVQLLQLISGYWLTQCVAVAAELGVADALAGGPLDVDTLAARVGADAGALHRLLRALASLGVFAGDADGYALTPLGECLRRDAEDSLRSLAIMRGSEWQWRAWRDLRGSVRTGVGAFERVHGQPLFDWLAQHPAESAVFGAAITGHTAQMGRALAGACDLSGVATLVDVGGGHGVILAALLGRHPQLRGTLLEQPHVLRETQTAGVLNACAGRVDLVGGDFFESVPAGADAYLLSHVLHDWDDDPAVRILETVRAAMRPASRLLIAEMVVPEDDAPHFSKLLDLEMLVMLGGRERTLAEYRRLLDAAGLQLLDVQPTPSPVSVLEARLA